MFISVVAHRSALRIVLALMICASLLLVPNATLFDNSASAQGQNQSSKREGRPRPGKPEGSLPDLEDVQNESRVEREPAMPIPSTMRSPKVPLHPWNGKRVGDPGTHKGVGQARSFRPDSVVAQTRDGSTTRPRNGRTRRAHASKSPFAPPTVLDDVFITNFFTWALLRSPSGDEPTFWKDQLRVAHAQGSTSLKLAAVELGKTLFESAEYGARTRTDQQYVYDLYKTFLMREPDGPGWEHWEDEVGNVGRENVRRAFEECPEFAAILSSIVLNGSPTANAASLISARVNPKNQAGNGMLTRDGTWSVALISLPGRAGLDLGLGLSYSSAVWTRSGPYIHFDEDNGFPSPGFRLGFPVVQRKVFDAQTAKNSFLFITAGGRRVELRQVGTSNVYEAGDSSYLQLIDNSPTLVVRSTDGTQLSFVEINNEYSCTQIKDRNGNYIWVNHNALGRITAVTDTLGRVINFNYDSNANLLSLTQSWNGQPSHQWVAFNWGTRTMQSSFTGAAVVGPKNGMLLPVITGVTLNDTSQVTFDYTNSLQVYLIRDYFGALQRSETSFTYETPGSDVPRLTDSRISAHNWTGMNGIPSQVITTYSVAGDGACVMTAPDGTIYKQYYGAGWQRGLTTLSEVWSGGVRQKWTTTAWTQDNTSVGYEVNPRVIETNVYDAGGNRRRTVIDYGSYAQWGLPYWIKEYAADGATEIRHTFTDYELSQTYLDKRIIGLVLHVHLKNATDYESKITYSYDEPARLQAVPAAATGHDTNYSTSLTARGNVTSVSRWDVTDINNASKKLTTYTNYYTTGTPISTTDASGHQSTVAYADAFSDTINRNTFAYPTTLTDADGYSSYVQYNFDFGATTRTQSPAPAGQSQGAIQTMTYNTLGQLERVTTTNNGAYKRFWYGADYTGSYATVNNVADESYSMQTFDGLGRTLGVASNHPGSTGGYKAQINNYDLMGRVKKSSNPAEITNAWVPTGDDAAGWLYTQQTYDWQGRPLVTTNPDTSTRQATYGGCGCAGGAVVTLTDEAGRRQKLYSDVLGRQLKSEVLNWNSSVYSTRKNTYNARDQITSVKQYQGLDSSGVYQEVVKTYDGYGRLATQKDPIQTTATAYTYNAVNQPLTVTDARGATQTFTYNNRNLPTQIAYSNYWQPLTAITVGYDAAGNRTSMTDGTGSKTYQYNQLSQLTSETRQFTGLSGSFTLSYEYNLAGALKAFTDHAGSRVDYAFNNLGMLTGVTGSGAHSLPTYLSNIAYRASGAIKDMNFGNGAHQHLNFNSRLLNTSMTLSNGSISATWSFDYYADGKIQKVTDSQNSIFDRAFDYDHIGRLQEARTGSEARGGSAPDGPFKQTYTYDVWENTTARSYRIWSSSMQSDGGTFTNNRRQFWTYDNEGNLGSDPDASYGYDAAGRQNHFVSNVTVGGWPTEHPQQPAMEILQTFDGDSASAKKTTINRWEEYLNEEVQIHQSTSSVYYLRSTALGKVIAGLDETGYKRQGYVFAGGMQIATQHVWNPGFGYDVELTTTSPATGSEYMVGGPYLGRKELDPLGADVTAPPQPQLLMEPVFYNPKFDQMLLQIEGGPSDEYEQNNADWANLVTATIQAAQERDRAEKLWQSGKRSEAMAILHANPNVGIEYRALVNGEVVSSGSVFGKDAADFLNGIDIALSTGLLSSEFGTSAYTFALAGGGSTGGASPTPQNTLTEDNPDQLQADNNGEDCGIVVNFKSGTTNSATGLPNGPSTLPYRGSSNFGLGFSVSGWAKGGVGTIGYGANGKKVKNPANPTGAWSLEQWTHSWIGQNGKTLVHKTTFSDLPLDAAGLTAQGHNFSYYDHPGGPPPAPGFARYDNYLIKVYKGKTVCEVGFHLIQIGAQIRWGRGLR
jgi:YD repeat-containing protein